MTDDVRVLADELQSVVLEAHPSLGWLLGLPGYGDRMDDLSAAAAEAHASRVAAIRERALAVDDDLLPVAAQVSRAAVLQAAEARLTEVAVAEVEFSLSPMGEGPVQLMSMSGRSRPTTPALAEDLLARTGAYARYLDQHVERLNAGAASGRVPVHSSRAVMLEMVDHYLAERSSDVLADIEPPTGWDRAGGWSARLRAVVSHEVRPAIQRWRDAAVALPTREDHRCGLVHLPGGEEDYARLVSLHTTVPVSAQQVHDLGLSLVEEITARMTELGASLGLHGFEAVREALRGSGVDVAPAELMRRSNVALSRAEAAVPGVVPPPAPPPCEVAPMPASLAMAGAPPHYTPPARDGSRVGTYWFNERGGTVGAGWELEATVFHETVPGHHLQVTRALAARDLTTLQAQGQVTAYSEGWGLYAEVLAEELGLYSGAEALLGALSARLFRAARLVVDTGIHARGWAREQAIRWLGETVTVNDAFVEAEVNRYIAHPGQALGYMVGQVELLRLRQDARSRLGPSFSLSGFHRSVLDSGVLPLPAVGVAVNQWVESQLASAYQTGGPALP